MNRRMFLGSALAVAALPVAGMAATKRTERIRIVEFTERMVRLKFPSARARYAFWVAFSDVLWPHSSRQGKGAELFEESWGGMLRGEGDFGGLTCPMARGGFFDDCALKTAVILKDQGILLDVIKTQRGPNHKHETVVLPEFYTFTETRAKV